MFIKKIQELYSKSIQENNIESQGIFHLIGNLCKFKILSITVINIILKDLIKCDTKYIESFLILWSYVKTILYINNKEIYTECENFIESKYPFISKRLQFLVIDINEQSSINNDDNDIEVDSNQDLQDKMYNYIEYIDEYDNIEDLLKEINEILISHNQGMQLFLNSILKYTVDNSKGIHRVKMLLTNGLKFNYWNDLMISETINTIKSHDLEDIIIDAPYYEKHLNEIILMINKNN